MKRAVLFSAMGVIAMGANVAQADEFGRVVSATPVVSQVAVPRQVCSTQPVAAQPSGGGALVGAIVGGLLGNAVGAGSGRAVATAAGVIGGAALGNSAEQSNARAQAMQQCSTQTTYENRTVAYNVTYEYGGKQYSVQMPQDPGPQVRLQVTPVGAATSAPATMASNTTTYVDNGQSYIAEPVGVSPVAVPTATVGYPVYYRPYYPGYYPAYYPYYAPVGVSIGFGFYGGGHRHWH